MIRFFCIALPAPPGSSSLGFDYLKAIHTTSSVRAMPIGPALLMIEPWVRLIDLFSTPFYENHPFVNVVCAPTDYGLGVPMTGADVLSPSHVSGGEAPLNEIPTNDVIYQPKSAIGGLYTVGVPNVAITLASQEISEDELRAINLYNVVISPTESHSEKLRDLGVKNCITMHPEPGALALLFEELLTI